MTEPIDEPTLLRVRDLLHAAGLEGDTPTDAEIAALVGGIVAATTTRVSPTVRTRWTQGGGMVAIEGWMPAVDDEFHVDGPGQSRHTYRIDTPYLRGQFEVIQHYPPPGDRAAAPRADRTRRPDDDVGGHPRLP